ncbi:helix-turn-helix domain-containing protein [uncultured Draconibacterium sp.]|uniref:helix-turn-helix domain-containing protein n=1 Tax=uncultured Draconibacterium sp. TaxID=1573823 RepID=UPI003747DE3A
MKSGSLEYQGLLNCQCKKKVLSFKEAAIYLDVSHSYLYKLTSQGRIPYFKPQGEKIYFDLSMLESWQKKNYQITQDEIEKKAIEYVTRNPLKF